MDPPPLLSHAASATAVDLKEDEKSVALSNSELELRFDRTRASLISLVYQGKELLASGGGYTQIAFTSRNDNPHVHWDYRIVRKTKDLIEISFVNTSQECPVDLESHFTLRAGEQGFHNYLVWGHDAQRTHGIVKLGQYNFALRVSSAIFTTAAVDDERIVRLPKSEWLTPAQSVMDSTYRLPDDTFYSKYFLSAERDEKHTVHGAMGETLGIWIIMPSHEHLNGGPEHQELTVHQGGPSQVLLAHATGAHYGAGILTSDSKDGTWKKVSAPWFIYVNTAASQKELWVDAKACAETKVRQWPYPWLDTATFQLDRGAVGGKLKFDSQHPANGARVILAPHEEKPSPLFWQQQWRGYRFYGWTDADGRFEIPKVRPGLYDLYAWQPGSFGQFLKKEIRVGSGECVDIGELDWRQPDRDTLWRIGTPDRSAQEFGFAENFRNWGLWQKINDAAPFGIMYIIGQSKERDWPFEMAVTQKPDLSWHQPVWRVQFNTTITYAGQAALRMGIAAYEGRQKPQLLVSLNGEPLGEISDLEISGAVHRSGIHAGFQERTLSFDAAKLKLGKNMLVFEMPAPGKPATKTVNIPNGGLLWDAVQLDVLSK